MTTEAESPDRPTEPLRPQEGLGALHLFYKVNLAAWRVKSKEERAFACDNLDAIVTHGAARAADSGRHSGHVRPGRHRLHDSLARHARAANAGENYLRLARAGRPRARVHLPVDDRKVGVYAKDDEYALELEKNEGIVRGTAESEARLITFRERIQHYTYDRLYPVLPSGNISASTR